MVTWTITLWTTWALRTRIRADIDERGWHKARGHFVDRHGGEHVDATLLLLPLVNFLPADDPRMSSTIDVIERELSEDGLVWRTRQGREKWRRRIHRL